MPVPPYILSTVGLYLFAPSSDRKQERAYHIHRRGNSHRLVGLMVLVPVETNTVKYASLCNFYFGSHISPPLTVAWLSGNKPGKCSLVLCVNGFVNLAGIIGLQLYRQEHGP